jgi:hypothetical protein
LHNEELHNFVFLFRGYQNDQIRENQVSGACNASGSDKKYIRIWQEHLKNGDHLEDFALMGD